MFTLWSSPSAYLLVLLRAGACQHKPRVIVGWLGTVNKEGALTPSCGNLELGRARGCLHSWWLSFLLTCGWLRITLFSHMVPLRKPALPNPPASWLAGSIGGKVWTLLFCVAFILGLSSLCTHSCQIPSNSRAVKVTTEHQSLSKSFLILSVSFLQLNLDQS